MACNSEITLHIVFASYDAVREKRKIRNYQKPDLRGGKRANDMIVKQYTLNHIRYDIHH